LGAAFGAAGAGACAVLAPWAGAGCWAKALEAIRPADSAVAASKVKPRPRGRTEAAKIQKFIAENPF
jgi:hypothetical protein